MGLTGHFDASVKLVNTKDGVDLSTPSDTLSQTTRKNTNNTYAYHDTLDILAGSVVALNVNDGSLSDVFGDAIIISGITSVYAKAAVGNLGNIVLSGGVDAFLATLPELNAGEAFLLQSDIDTSAGLDTLYFTSPITSGSVDIIFTGV